MDEDLDLTYLECASVDRQKHFLIQPFLLTCGHYMCFNCIENEVDEDNNLKCCFCNDTKTAILENNQPSILANQVIKAHIQRLFDIVSNKCSEALNQIKSLFGENKERVEIQYQYLKEEIERRADSLKNEIDELCKKIYGELDAQKSQILSEIEPIYSDIIKFEKEIDESRQPKDANEIDESLTIMQEKLDDLYLLKEHLNEINKQVVITERNRFLDVEFIGYFDYTTTDDCHNIPIPSKFDRSIEIAVKPCGFCVLPEDRLLIAADSSYILCSYDQNMNLISEIKDINKAAFEPFAVTTNGIDKLFICDNANNKLLLTDFCFNLLGIVVSNQLKDPYGICFANDLLYVCDFKAQSILTFKDDLTFEASFELDFSPWYIEVIDQIACIRPYNEFCITFYKLPEFSVKYKYFNHNGSICIVGSNFYEFHQPTSTLYCYNSDGTICRSRVITLPDNIHINKYDKIVYFQNKFIISSTVSKSILILK